MVVPVYCVGGNPSQLQGVGGIQAFNDCSALDVCCYSMDIR